MELNIGDRVRVIKDHAVFDDNLEIGILHENDDAYIVDTPKWGIVVVDEKGKMHPFRMNESRCDINQIALAKDYISFSA
jgi:hypothetical protein